MYTYTHLLHVHTSSSLRTVFTLSTDPSESKRRNTRDLYLTHWIRKLNCRPGYLQGDWDPFLTPSSPKWVCLRYWRTDGCGGEGRIVRRRESQAKWTTGDFLLDYGDSCPSPSGHSRCHGVSRRAQNPLDSVERHGTYVTPKGRWDLSLGVSPVDYRVGGDVVWVLMVVLCLQVIYNRFTYYLRLNLYLCGRIFCSLSLVSAYESSLTKNKSLFLFGLFLKLPHTRYFVWLKNIQNMIKS